MILFHSQDTSYFNITSPDVDSTFRVLNGNVISFSLREEMRRMNSGTIALHDPNQVYSKILRAGVKLNIEWGFKEQAFGLRALSGKLNSIGDEIYGVSSRNNFQAIIQHPSGTLSQNGQETYNINFFGWEYVSTKNKQIHRVATRYDVINGAMERLGIPANNRVISFVSESVALNENTHVIQRESDFRFLIRLSYEWRVAFRLGYDRKGSPVGVFIDYDKLDKPNYIKLLGHIVGGSHIHLEYKKPNANVISATWKQNAGTQGGGDNVRIIMGPNGQPQFFRYVAEGETVRVYKLVPERIGNELRRAGNIADQTKLLVEWLKVTDFQQIKKYFDEVDQSTAPQGYGYEISIEMYGNPMLTAPLIATFGSGFPALLQRDNPKASPNKFYMNSVDHKIDRRGYFITAQVMDALSITGGSYI